MTFASGGTSATTCGNSTHLVGHIVIETSNAQGKAPQISDCAHSSTHFHLKLQHLGLKAPTANIPKCQKHVHVAPYGKTFVSARPQLWHTPFFWMFSRRADASASASRPHLDSSVGASSHQTFHFIKNLDCFSCHSDGFTALHFIRHIGCHLFVSSVAA